MGTNEESAESQLKVLDEKHQKYKFMESNLVNRRRRLKGQIPDIKSSLIMIDHLREKSAAKEEIESIFSFRIRLTPKQRFLQPIRCVYGLEPTSCLSTH